MLRLTGLFTDKPLVVEIKYLVLILGDRYETASFQSAICINLTSANAESHLGIRVLPWTTAEVKQEHAKSYDSPIEYASDKSEE